MSSNQNMFNLFLTFSVADLHEPALHEKLPGSETKKYLNKTVVKDLDLLPMGSDKSTFIDEKTDYQLRMKAMNANPDIVNAYLIKKVNLLWKHVLKPIFGGEEFIRRYEFQHRGSIHCHMVMSVEHGPSCGEMDLARKDFPNLATCEIQEQHNAATTLSEHIKASKKKIEEFNSHIMGVSAIHPDVDPANWPAPYGQNVYRPVNNVLRVPFEKIKNNPSKIYEHYTSLINRMMLHKCKMGYCLDHKRVKMEKVYGPDHNILKGPDGKEVKRKKYICRFDFPMEILGFDYSSIENGKLDNVTPVLDNEGNLKVNGSCYDSGKLKLLRNHPDLVTHIPELLVIWGANTDQKTITAYPQLLNYLLKYLMKNESQSDFFTNIAKTVTGNLDDEAPVRKAAQKILLSSVGQRDMSINECMLICHNQPYVEYSKTPRMVNLKGSTKVKGNVISNDEVLLENDNWQEAYWQRESCPGYKILCDDYPTKFKYSKHPKDISLREFIVNFTKKWKFKPANVYPHFIPTYRYIVHKGKANYEDFCKFWLLQDKPGCYFDNVGKEFSSCEAELKHFVENSAFCPELLKEEFEQSQIVLNESNNEKSVEGDAFDELFNEVNAVPENASKDDWMECFSLGFDGEFDLHKQAASDDEGSDYDEALANDEIQNYDWQSDRRTLNMTTSEIKEAAGWIDHKKKVTKLSSNVQCSVNPSNLNTKQKKAYDFITSWIDEKVSNRGKDPIYINVSGRAGCGKTFFLNCTAEYATEKGGHNFLQKAGPTATAAFQIGGSTLHAMFKLNVQSSTKKELPNLRGEPLRDLQESFKNSELLVIDEKSMVGLYMMYTIDQRLREIKPRNAHLPFGGLSVILMGDFAQLPPVGDKPLFVTNTKDLSKFQCTGISLFKMFNKTIIFNQIMRQQGDDQKQFREILDRLSNGTFTKDDWLYLKKRELYGDGDISEIQKKEFLENATMLCAYNRDLKEYNMRRTKILGNPIAVIKSQNSDQTVANLLSSKAQGLPSQVMLAKDCQVILTSNLWKEPGLTNGAKGIVKFIVFEGNAKPKALPSLVIVQFPDYIGPSFLNDLEKCVPIVPLRRSWFMGKKLCWRIMLPLKLAYATSIHSCQGTSMDRVIINIGKREFSTGLTYTAISRCKKIEYLSFYPMKNYSRFTSIKRAKTFSDRLIQDQKEKEADAMFDLD